MFLLVFRWLFVSRAASAGLPCEWGDKVAEAPSFLGFVACWNSSGDVSKSNRLEAWFTPTTLFEYQLGGLYLGRKEIPLAHPAIEGSGDNMSD